MTTKHLSQKVFSIEDRDAPEGVRRAFGTYHHGIVWFVESKKSQLWFSWACGHDCFNERNLTSEPLMAFAFASKEHADRFIKAKDIGKKFISTEHEFIDPPSNPK